MSTVSVEVPAGAPITAELLLPGGPGPHPGVVVLHELLGLNDDIRRIARRFTEHGYAAICPGLYTQGNRIACLTAVLADLARSRFDRRMAPILAARDRLADEPSVDAERIAVAGFCMGGGFALIAGTDPRFRASAVHYGDVPKDRERLRGSCPVIASYGRRDKLFGNAGDALERHLTALGIEHDVKTYDTVGHSFMSVHEDGSWESKVIKLPSPLAISYDEQVAEDAWARMLAFFERHVRGAGG